MKGRLILNKTVKIIAIPLMIIALSLYLPDVYHCDTLIQGSVEEIIASATCFSMVINLQMTMLFAGGTFALILLLFEFYKFKFSYSKKSKVEGQ